MTWGEAQKAISDKNAEIERLKAERLELACWVSDESQIVSGCRDDYERGRYDALRWVAVLIQRAREAAK